MSKLFRTELGSRYHEQNNCNNEIVSIFLNTQITA